MAQSLGDPWTCEASLHEPHDSPPRQAVILAAGEGRRLRPVTRHTPKALVPFFGVPLLDHAAAHVVAAGVRRVAVNAHYLGDAVAAHVEQVLAARYPDVSWTVSREPALLGTGGALDHLSVWLGAEAFYVVNADAVFDASLVELAAAAAARGADAAWLVTRDTTFARLRTVLTDAGGAVSAISADPRPDAWVFCGVHVAGPGLLARLPAGRASCAVRDGYLPWIRAGARVAAVDLECARGAFWADTGTPERYVDAHARGLASSARWRELGLYTR